MTNVTINPPIANTELTKVFAKQILFQNNGSEFDYVGIYLVRLGVDHELSATWGFDAKTYVVTINRRVRQIPRKGYGFFSDIYQTPVLSVNEKFEEIFQNNDEHYAIFYAMKDIIIEREEKLKELAKRPKKEYGSGYGMGYHLSAD